MLIPFDIQMAFYYILSELVCEVREWLNLEKFKVNYLMFERKSPPSSAKVNVWNYIST